MRIDLSPFLIYWCLPPEKGPSKPALRKARMIPTAPPEFTIDSSLRSGKGTAVGYEISGAGVPFCPSPPFPSSPASGRGDETYGWANSRSPLHLSPTWLIISTAQSKSTIPPSLRFPPLREGNQALRFPLLAGGTCRRGSSSAVFCELWCGDWYEISATDRTEKRHQTT